MTAAKLAPEAQAQLAELMVSLAADPKIGKQVKKRISELDPTKRFMDVESDELAEKFNTMKEEQKQERERERLQEKLNMQRANLIESGRFTEDEVKEMEKSVMETHGISDYNVAAKVYASDKKPAAPTHEINSRVWQMPVTTKEDIQNLNQKTLTDAYGVVDEIRGRKRA